MHVGRIMQRDLITIPPDTSVIEARRIISEHKIDHLLVVDKGERLMGVLSDRDLKQSWASSATTLSQHELNYLLDQLTAALIMSTKIITVMPETTVERAARIMQESNISALPVMDKDKLVGIITRTDVMQVLLEAIGIDSDSTRFTVIVKDRTGVIADISRLLLEHGISIRSLVTWPEKAYPGVYQLVLRVPARHGDQAVKVLEENGFKVLTQYTKNIENYI
ncbi:MAG: CBS and ACT domain-containing protein [Desulfobacterales bacterium]